MEQSVRSELERLTDDELEKRICFFLEQEDMVQYGEPVLLALNILKEREAADPPQIPPKLKAYMQKLLNEKMPM